MSFVRLLNEVELHYFPFEDQQQTQVIHARMVIDLFSFSCSGQVAAALKRGI